MSNQPDRPETDSVQRALEAGETVLWIGQPGPADQGSRKKGRRVPGLGFILSGSKITYVLTNRRAFKISEGLWRRVADVDLRFLVELEMDGAGTITLEELRSNWPNPGRYKRLSFERLPNAVQVFEQIQQACDAAQAGAEP
jgi:hypothetical protein